MKKSTSTTKTKTAKKTKTIVDNRRKGGGGGGARYEERKHKQMKALKEQRKYQKYKEGRGKASEGSEMLTITTGQSQEKLNDGGNAYIEGYYEEDDDEEDAEDNNTSLVPDEVSSESDLSESEHSFCRHCLRPQSDLQLRYLRPRQRSKLRNAQQAKRERSKSRGGNGGGGGGSGGGGGGSRGNGGGGGGRSGGGGDHSRTRKKRSKSRAKRARNSKHYASGTGNNTGCNNRKEQQRQQQQQQHKLPLIRDLNAANEQAIRFRCPQVGPQVGRDRQMPPLLHFHHPQHVQQQLTAYQVQYTLTTQPHMTEAKLQQQAYAANCKHYSPTSQHTTLTMESELRHHQHHYHHQQQQPSPQSPHHVSDNQKSSNQVPQQTTDLTKDVVVVLPSSEGAVTEANAATASAKNCCSTQPTNPNCQQSVSAVVPGSCRCHATTTATTIITAGATNQPTTIRPTLPQLPLASTETVIAPQGATPNNNNVGHMASSANAAAIATATTTTMTTNNINNPTVDETTIHTATLEPGHATAATTPESPSLVKVSTWYTVAKQGVSC
ncbi:probable serine/threonine-protein kinase mkcB [Musca domestica]|uniref:Probable serine/threonine-protein kinase mkcB n=1 Tax=Musca domestica TaxID=7370 RepID=A0ABM3UTE8_MUSDO|nr:probable serine/threonine-protein kinase mkcB [Musca domestica]